MLFEPSSLPMSVVALGSPMPRSALLPHLRILQRATADPSGCLLWHGAKHNKGYGCIHIGSTLDGTARVATTHRVIWEFYRGQIPDGMCVCHRCDVPNCVNIEHLFLGTIADNQTDMAKKGRSPRGLNHWNGRLSATDVSLIRASLSSASALAERFAVHPAYIRAIRRGRERTV